MCSVHPLSLDGKAHESNQRITPFEFRVNTTWVGIGWTWSSSGSKCLIR